MGGCLASSGGQFAGGGGDGGFGGAVTVDELALLKQVVGLPLFDEITVQRFAAEDQYGAVPSGGFVPPSRGSSINCSK